MHSGVQFITSSYVSSEYTTYTPQATQGEVLYLMPRLQTLPDVHEQEWAVWGEDGGLTTGQ